MSYHGIRRINSLITPLTLQTLSRKRVFLEAFELDEERTVRHIELTRKAAAFVVAPATANTLAKMARGVADDLLTTFYVSVAAPVVVAPSMNTRMLLHPATQENLRVLRSRGVRIVEPTSGWLAEGEVGWGRMAEPEQIVGEVLAAARRSTALAGRHVVVTAGPTCEAVDPVRYLTNRSSGKMGYALAEACARRGARVTLVSGPVDLAPPFGVEHVSVRTAEEMREAVLRVRAGAEAVFMAAAVGDWRPRRRLAGKWRAKDSGARTA